MSQMDIMSNLQTLSSNTPFRELLRKFRQEEASSSSFMSWFTFPEDSLSSSSFWWENNSDKDEDSTEDTSTIVTSPQGECNTKKPYNTSASTHWLAYEDQDTVSLSCSSSDEDSYEASISSASSVCSDDEKHYIDEEYADEEYADDEYYEEEEEKEKYLPALGWWKVYRSGWWENSEGASTHFDETYVEYRYSALLPPISENHQLEEAQFPLE